MNRHLPYSWRWLWLSAMILVLDQAIKQFVLLHLSPYFATPVMPGFNLLLAYNQGVAFSLFGNFEDTAWLGLAFIGLALFICGGLLYWLAQKARADWRSCVPITLIIGGALGNVVDRMIYGYVIDYIDWYAGSYHWATFNLADAMICLGAAGLICWGHRQQAD